MAEQKFLQPRARTPLPDATGAMATGRLPDDLLDEHVRRFGIFTAIGAGLWTFALFMHVVLIPRTGGPSAPWWSIVLDIVAILGSAAWFLYVRYASHCSQTKTDVGLFYMLLNAVAVAVLNTRRLPAVDPEQLSWNTIVILVSAMIMPTSPRKMFAATMVAASTDPLMTWLAHLRGMPVPSPVDTLVAFMPNYACAIVGLVPSYAMRRIGHRLRQAQELGSYQLIEMLGRGGMGEVWRARHRLLARHAAVKLVRPEVLGASSDGDLKTLLRRFEREAQATAALSSPHTIRLFDFGASADGTFYYVMELLAGRDLESLVREFGPLPPDRTMYLLRQACHSLADAHARGMVHRDIKPANIYVCRMGLDYDFVKVLDFGLVKVDAREPLSQTLTVDHTTTGTPAFMAPEIILGERDVDQRADVYALGCVAYYLLTGELVFEADTPMKMLLHHVQTPPIPPSQRTELPIPKELDELVLACLEKDPRRRPQDAGQLFGLACQCRSCEAWNNEAARRWWELHLSEFCGPLTMIDLSDEAAPTGVAAN